MIAPSAGAGGAGVGGIEAGGRPWSLVGLAVIVCLCLACIVGLLELGTWQVHRRVWKLALIAHVDERIHAAPVAPPGPSAWPGITAANAEYTRLALSGHFLNDKETLVVASTELGGGFWVLTPFQTDQGFTVLVNRGFVPPERRDPATRAAGQIGGETRLGGLLRITEPGGTIMRSNVPAENRWYSRDVAAIAAARGVTNVAPYFVDADGAPRGAPIPDGMPVGGLTVIAFPNNHLMYAITWYVLALMMIGALVYVVRDAWRQRRPHPAA
jgi:surfeit locus 1 family protein